MSDTGGSGADDVTAERERSIRRRQTVRLAMLAVVSAVLAVWAISNMAETEIDWLVATTSTPLVSVIALAALLGFVLGAVVVGRRGD